MIIIIILLIIILIIYFIQIEQFTSSSVAIRSCEFKPNTEIKIIQQCYNDCYYTNNCNDIDECKEICNNCLDCDYNVLKQNKLNSLKPEKINLRGFSGNGCLKITWIKPYSNFSILNYYIIVTSNDHSNPNFMMIHYYKNDSDILEYIVKDLENDVIYEVMILSKNDFGISELSNIESILTNTKSLLQCDNSSDISNNSSLDYSNRFDNNLYNNKIMNDLDDMKRILVDNLKLKLSDNIQIYNIDIN